MIFGPSGRVHGPQNQLFLTLDPPNHVNKHKKNTKYVLRNIICGQLGISKNGNVGKDACRTILEIRFISS